VVLADAAQDLLEAQTGGGREHGNVPGGCPVLATPVGDAVP
jgi:hypothetical protein